MIWIKTSFEPPVTFNPPQLPMGATLELQQRERLDRLEQQMMMSAIQANRRMNIGRPQPMVSSASGRQMSSGQDQRHPSIEKITCQGVVLELHLKELDLKAHCNRYCCPRWVD